MDRIRAEFPRYRIAILHVHAKKETILQRAEVSADRCLLLWHGMAEIGMAGFDGHRLCF
jgi:hypothetical protein